MADPLFIAITLKTRSCAVCLRSDGTSTLTRGGRSADPSDEEIKALLARAHLILDFATQPPIPSLRRAGRARKK